MKILINKEVVKEEWNKFVYDNPKGNIFQTYEFYEIYQKTKNLEPILIVIKNNEIVCGLLAYISTEKPGVFSSFTKRAIIIGGPLYSKKGKASIKKLIRKFNCIVKNKVLFSQIRNLFDSSDLKKELNLQKYSFEPHLNFLIDLKKSEEELWQNISKSKRKSINKAKNSLEIINSDSIDNVYSLLSETYKLIKIPLVDLSYFKFAKKLLGDKLLIYKAKIGEEEIGCRLILSYKDQLYDWYAGAREKYLNHFTNDLLVWNLLKDYCHKDFNIFDFGGAGHPKKKYGVREFKRRFGGKLVNYGRYQKVYKPVLYNILKGAFLIYRKIRK
jgi:serine/alanine adding enzyme